MSAKEKLSKSAKNLAYTSSGIDAEVDEEEKPSKPASKSSTIERKKVGGVVLDLETIEDATKQKFDTRGRRNSIVILILSLLLAASLVYLAVAIVAYNNSKKAPNCFYRVEGDASAEWIIQGGSRTDFVIGEGLAPNTIYLINSVLNVKTKESVMITVEIEVLLENEPILISGLQEAHSSLIRVQNTNKYVYQGTVTGGGQVLLFRGIDFSNAPDHLHSHNVRVKVTAKVNKM